MKSTTTVTFGLRPTHVTSTGGFSSVEHSYEPLPAGWVVFNAPRPLFGHLTWQAVGPTGIHYAAVDGSSAHAGWMVEANMRDRAVIVEYESEKSA